MNDHARLARLAVCIIIAATTSTLVAGAARAQEVASPPAAPSPAPAEPAAAPLPPAAAPAGTPPSAVATEAKPPTAAEAMPATRPEVLPPIDVGAWVRAGGIFQGADQSKLNDWHMDHAYVELHTGGRIHKKVGVTLNLNADMINFRPPGSDMTTEGGSYVAVEDAIISFDFMDEFHVWGGRLLVTVDRANSSGPFFMIPWNYPGFSASPKEGPTGRNNGAVVWGDIAAGKLTYFAGAYDNADIGTSPLFSGRVRLALLDPETGFWGNCSYFGDKDVLSFDVGGQFQKHGSATAAGDKDWAEVNIGALFEKKIPGGGWFTGEGAYYHFNVQDMAVGNSFYLLAAYASPTVGVGNLQPMVRFQLQNPQGGGTNPWNVDGAVAYLVKGPALRAIATYSHTKIAGGVSANSIQIGAQAIFF